MIVVKICPPSMTKLLLTMSIPVTSTRTTRCPTKITISVCASSSAHAYRPIPLIQPAWPPPSQAVAPVQTQRRRRRRNQHAQHAGTQGRIGTGNTHGSWDNVGIRTPNLGSLNAWLVRTGNHDGLPGTPMKSTNANGPWRKSASGRPGPVAAAATARTSRSQQPAPSRLPVYRPTWRAGS